MFALVSAIAIVGVIYFNIQHNKDNSRKDMHGIAKN